MIINRISGCDSDSVKNTGKTGCGRKEGQLLKLYLSFTDTKIAIDPDTGKILEASFQEAIQAKTLFPVRNADSSEDAGTEDQFFESATGESVLMRDGIDGVRAFISASAQEYISLLSFDARTLRVWELDQNGNLTFVDIDGDGSYAAGRLTDQFYIQKRTRPTDATTPKQTPIFIKYSDSNEWKDGLAVMNDMDFMSQLDGLIDCEFEATNPATSGLSVQISVATTGIGVSGAVAPSTDPVVAGDLEILDSEGVEVAITSLTESTTKGLYAVLGTFVAESSYTIGFREPADMALEGYDTYAVATFEIPAA